LWQRPLLPWAKKIAGPPSDRQLAEIQPIWAEDSVWKNGVPTSEKLKKLDRLSLKNVSGKDLTDVVVEIVLENEWKEKGYNYYYLSTLKAASTVRLTIHPRWQNRNAPYSKKVTTKFSIWAKEASDANRETTFDSPNPDPNANDSQRIFRARDNLNNVRTDGSALARKLLSCIP
jgi:hypothetical protein